MWQALLVFVVADGVANAFRRPLNVIDINRDEAFRRKIVRRIGRTVVKRERRAEKGVRQLLGPVVRAHVILHRQVVPVRVQALGLVIQRLHPLAEDLQFRQLGLQRPGEVIAPPVQGVALAFRRAHGGDLAGLLQRRPREHLVVRPLALTAETVVPEHPLLGMDAPPVLEGPFRVRGQHAPELPGKTPAVGLDGRRLHGYQERALGPTGQLFAVVPVAPGVGRKFVVDHQPVVVRYRGVENELAAPPAPLAVRQLMAPDTLAHGREKLDPNRTRGGLGHGRSPPRSRNSA